MNDIQLTVKKLIKKHKTNNPFILCSNLDITVTVTALPPHIKGFFTVLLGMKFIFLNSTLDDCELRCVCAHELGHAVLHGEINTLFLKTKTYILPSKYEHEADIFAANILISQAEIDLYKPFCESIARFAYELNVPENYVQLRLA